MGGGGGEQREGADGSTLFDGRAKMVYTHEKGGRGAFLSLESCESCGVWEEEEVVGLVMAWVFVPLTV